MDNEKELTREERIAAYGAEHQRRLANAKEMEGQLKGLVSSLKQMDIIKVREIEKTLDGLPDASPKGIVDKVLQLPDAKRGQLLGNIDKLKIGIENENRKAKIAAGKKKQLEDQIVQEKIDEHTRQVYRVFLEWVNSYKACRAKFHNELRPIIEAGYNKDPFFHKRAEQLGLNKSVMVSIESHFRQGEVISMEEAIEKILNLSDAYGEPLLKKDGFSGSWPDNPESYFGFSEFKI